MEHIKHLLFGAAILLGICILGFAMAFVIHWVGAMTRDEAAGWAGIVMVFLLGSYAIGAMVRE